MLAYDYPILGVFWSMMIFFLWFAWIMLVFRVIGDIFSNSEMKGIAKAFWLIFVIILPWFGVLIYLIVNGTSMAGRSIERQQAAQDEFASFVRQSAGSSADELAKLASLRDSGVLTAEEFAAQKSKLLA
jgi:CBS domain containing-hemolysin-like protein